MRWSWFQFEEDTVSLSKTDPRIFSLLTSLDWYDKLQQGSTREKSKRSKFYNLYEKLIVLGCRISNSINLILHSL